MRKTKRIETPWRSVASETDKESKVFIKRLNLQIYRELQLIALIVYTSWNYYCRYCHYLVIYATECETGCRSTEINARNVIDRVPIQDRTIIIAQKNSRGRWSQSALYRRSHSFSRSSLELFTSRLQLALASALARGSQMVSLFPRFFSALLKDQHVFNEADAHVRATRRARERRWDWLSLKCAGRR